jgi:hypothetical protein
MVKTKPDGDGLGTSRASVEQEGSIFLVFFNADDVLS